MNVVMTELASQLLGKTVEEANALLQKFSESEGYSELFSLRVIEPGKPVFLDIWFYRFNVKLKNGVIVEAWNG